MLEDILALRVQINHHLKDTHKDALIDTLFKNINFDVEGTAEWNGEVFTICKEDRLKKRIFNLFGASLSIDEIDKNIAQLIEDQNGYLESKQDDHVELTSATASAELDTICSLIAGSLSQDLVKTVRTLLQNINEIVSGSSFSGTTSRIDVNLFEKHDREHIVIHCRYKSQIKDTGYRVLWCKTVKRAVRLDFSMRRLGISKRFCEHIMKHLTPETKSRDIKDQNLSP